MDGIGRIIETDACVAEGVDWLRRADPRLVPALEAGDGLPLRRRPGGFASLLFAIVSQQVSVASATSVWSRMEAAGMITPEAIRASDEDALRALGLSRQKAVYARALAEARIDYDGLRHRPDGEVIETLVAVKGIGLWTAEIYAMFSLGRADVFAAGDLAMQEAARILFDLPERPNARALRQMAEPWSPWRSVAARALWAYYMHEKNREGIR